MKNKITNIAAVLALIGLAYNIYTNKGISVEDFLILGAGIGLFASYRSKTGGKLPIDDDEETDA